MERLTTNKKVSKMEMYELALNCCYIDKNGSARYRDFDTNIDAREFARNLMKKYGYWKSYEELGPYADHELVDDDFFDGSMLDNLMYGPDEIIGLIALFYRNLWAMAELRETLKEYEDMEEQGLLHKAPLKNGTPIWYFQYSFDEGTYLTNSTYLFGVTEYEIGEFGKDFWLSEEEALSADEAAEQALAEMKGE